MRQHETVSLSLSQQNGLRHECRVASPLDASGFYPDDPLWDGSGCTTSSTCCSFNNPPYFTKQLPNPTSDDIEARLCRYESDEDSPVELMELYVMVVGISIIILSATYINYNFACGYSCKVAWQWEEEEEENIPIKSWLRTNMLSEGFSVLCMP